MKIKFVILTLLTFVAGAAHANQFNTQCAYSHTLPDDPIVYPGKPGEAMVHDFFGNANTDAYSTYDSLNNNKVITCDSAADRSAYWAPQLKRKSGIIFPMYQKTYYKNDQPVADFPVQPIPAGLEMLAGNHMGTAPNPHINFLCAGSGNYTTTMPQSCLPTSGATTSQLNISVHFPDCWNGKTLVPILGKNGADRMKSLMRAASGALNVAYRNSDGTCPTGYKTKIPELQMNISYDLGNDPDLSTAQLSLDPVLQNGQWIPQWGSMYTAHGDFINAWHAQTMQYMVDTCMNKGGTSGGIEGATCNKSIPVYYSTATANVQLDGNGAVRPTGATLVSAPGDVILIKFPMPENLDDYPYVGSYLQTFGGNVTDTAADTLWIYSATTDWDDASKLPTASACSTSDYIGKIYADNVQQVRANDISAYVASQKQAGAKQIAICIRNATSRTFQFSSRQGSWAPGLYLK
jgi:hypothetical protein